MSEVPYQMREWMSQLPQKNVGDFYFTIRNWFGIPKEYKLEAWGQLCDGTDHRDYVGNAVHNNRLGPCTYVAWRSVPDHPDLCKYPTSGNVDPPLRFDPKDAK